MNTKAKISDAIGLLCEAFWHAVYALALAALSVGRFLDNVLSLLGNRMSNDDDMQRSNYDRSFLAGENRSSDLPDLGIPDLPAGNARHSTLCDAAGGTASNSGSLGNFEFETGLACQSH